MLPQLHKDGSSTSCSSTGIWNKLQSWTRLILNDKNSRNLFFFLLLNFTFAFVELFYGIFTNSLGLISDSFHMFFDCTGLLAGLAASIITKWRANDKYSYGYVRAEVIAGFVNGLFLIFISFFIFCEAVERLIEPPEVKHERLLPVSIAGFLVNLVGIFVFQHGGAHGGHGGCSHGGGHSHSHGHSHDHGHDHKHDLHQSHSDHLNHNHNHNHVHNHNSSSQILIHDEPENNNSQRSQIMQGVFLHILADTLGSVGVIISAILMWAFGWMIADPICSMFIAVLIFISVLALLKGSVVVLMQRQPMELDHLLPGCYNKVMQLEGVYSVQEPHFWTLCTDFFVGAIKLEVGRNADPRYLVNQTQNIFASIGVRQLYVQLDYNIT